MLIADRQRLGNGLSQCFLPMAMVLILKVRLIGRVDPMLLIELDQELTSWYKNSDMGGRWDILAGIMFGYNTIGVVRQPGDLDNMNQY